MQITLRRVAVAALITLTAAFGPCGTIPLNARDQQDALPDGAVPSDGSSATDLCWYRMHTELGPAYQDTLHRKCIQAPCRNESLGQSACRNTATQTDMVVRDGVLYGERSD